MCTQIKKKKFSSIKKLILCQVLRINHGYSLSPPYPLTPPANKLTTFIELVSEFSSEKEKNTLHNIIDLFSSLMDADCSAYFCYDSKKNSLKCLASSDLCLFTPDKTYQRHNTPCDTVITLGKEYIYTDTLTRLFPDNTVITDNAIRGYAGSPVLDTQGNTVGVISCFYKKNIGNQKKVENRLTILSHILSEMFKKDGLKKALSSVEKKLSTINNSSMLCIAQVSPEGEILSSNSPWRKNPLLTETKNNKQFLSTKLVMLKGGPLFQNKEITPDILNAENVYNNKIVIRNNGIQNIFLINASPLKDDTAFGPANCIIELLDITKQTEQKNNLNLILEAINSTNEAISITNADGEYIQVNSAFEKITGYTAKEVIGKNPRILQSGRHSSEFYKKMWGSVVSQGFWEGEIWNKRKDGVLFPEHLVIKKITSEQGETTNYIAIFEDETLKHLINKKMTELSELDNATGLPNKSATLENLNSIINTEKHFCLFILSITEKGYKLNKKSYNINKETINNISDIIRKKYQCECFVGVISSTEFAIILTDFDIKKTPLLLKTISTYITKLSLINLSKSGIGAIIKNRQIHDAKEYIILGREAARHASLDTVEPFKILDPITINTVRKKAKLETELLDALFKGDIYPAYEPFVDLSNNRIIGVESLARWEHPTLGMIPPTTFLDIALESGVFNQLTKKLLELSCKHMKKWLDAGCILDRLAVNVAAQQIDLLYLPNLLESALSMSGLDPRYLQIEVTEEALVDTDQSSQLLHKLCDMGIRISIDDFGTGYSSLSYLKNLPAHTLKIDRSFVKDLTNNEKDAAIVKSIISLAMSLGLEVIAEGIENERQLDILISLGCNIGQGYYYSKAKKENQFKLFLSRYNSPT